LTPAQQALNAEIKETDVIKEIHDEVGSLKDGQSEIKRMIDKNEKEAIEQFEKGSAMFKKLNGEIENIKGQIKDGFKQQSSELNGFIAEMKDDRIEKLSKQIDRRKEFWSGVAKTVLAAVLITVAVYVLAKFGITTK